MIFEMLKIVKKGGRNLKSGLIEVYQKKESYKKNEPNKGAA